MYRMDAGQLELALKNHAKWLVKQIDGIRISQANADFCGMWLVDADLRGASFLSCDMTGVDLRGANLQGADFRGSTLRGAKFLGCKVDDKTQFSAFQIPQEGALIVWKKVCMYARGWYEDYIGDCLLKLKVTGKRTASVVGRKCRAASALVLGAYDLNGKKITAKKRIYKSKHDLDFVYEIGKVARSKKDKRVGAEATGKKYDPNPLIECTNGIHFFLTFAEARDY